MPHEAIHSPSGQVPLEIMYALWEKALHLTGDSMLALHAAEKVPFGGYRLLDYMFAASASPKEGFIRSSRSVGIMNNALVTVFRLHQDHVYLELHSLGKSHRPPRPYVEYILSLNLTRIRFVTQVDCKPTEVHFTYPEPRVAKEYERMFGTRIRFNQPVNRLVFARQLMEMPHPHPDPELCELLECHARRGLTCSRGDKHPLEEIREALVYNLTNARATLGHLSVQLGMSSRSLQRKILANGMTFRELLDDIRQERASQLLRNTGISIKEVASRLQFSDVSSFSHAFYRWTGVTPAVFRRTSPPTAPDSH